ncbi:protein of unknown function [Tenacibaculum jejuense]|uniref:Uncharacterized protein n=1 Tax=Tenacibaculum jejuense TaxID=584609 RepID=A0A238U423_9FLAO|nr:protein of unknown function [Tenacibaculum jejuense]
MKKTYIYNGYLETNLDFIKEILISFLPKKKDKRSICYRYRKGNKI